MVKVRNSIKWQDYASVLILISDLISLAVGNESIHAFIKPLVVPSIAFFFFSKDLIKFKIGKYLALVLLFSWLGDILLIFDSSLHFLLGLFSFLIAHFFYYSLFGALLFIISDALIALNTFHIVSVEGINYPFLIMFTYICAQLILVYSVVNQMNKN